MFTMIPSTAFKNSLKHAAPLPICLHSTTSLWGNLSEKALFESRTIFAHWGGNSMLCTLNVELYVALGSNVCLMLPVLCICWNLPRLR